MSMTLDEPVFVVRLLESKERQPQVPHFPGDRSSSVVGGACHFRCRLREKSSGGTHVSFSAQALLVHR